MSQTILNKTRHLEQIFNYLDEEDWLRGLDLYQEFKVGNVGTYQGLISAVIDPKGVDRAEVRIKLHPSGRVIQWVECTCPKNRSRGAYCEHIAALLIQIDREHSNLFVNLDRKSPIKPAMINVRAMRRAKAEANAPAASTALGDNPKSFLEHLLPSLKKAALYRQGPNIRLTLEIRAGQTSLMELDIDESAQFLFANSKLACVTPELRALAVGTQEAELGTYIYPKNGENIVAERVVAVKLTKKLAKQLEGRLKTKLLRGECFRYLGTEKSTRSETYIFLPVKKSNTLIGNHFFFLVGHGYLRLNRSSVTPQWHERPHVRSYANDAAANLLLSHFEDDLALGPIWVEESLRKQTIEEPKLQNVAIKSEKDGWFYLDPIYGEGTDSIPMAGMMNHFQKKNRKFVRTDKAWLHIPEFITQHNWELDPTGNYLKVDILGLIRMKAHLKDDLSLFSGTEPMVQKLQKRLNFDEDIEAPDLSDTKLTLRNYQMTGYKWLWWLYTNGLPGLLADDMGLGKTHQAMAIISAIKSQKGGAINCLVVCPTTVLDHWEDKLKNFAPALQVCKYHGPNRNSMLGVRAKHDVFLTSYGVLLREIKSLEQTQWDIIILDEAHYVKNNNTATYRSACRLSGKLRLCLTGTPMENHLGELKNLFDFLAPGYLGTDQYFKRHFLLPITQGNDSKREKELKKLLNPLKLRRTKDQVLKDLPEKVEDTRRCGLSPEQVALYRDIVNLKSKPIIDQLRDESEPIPYLHVFTTLQLLKQVCNHPALIKAGSDYRNHESEKFELLKEIMHEAIDSGNKIVIFSQYIGMINIIQQYCKHQEITFATLTGQTKNRGQVIRSFQEDPGVHVFIGSLLAGGIGIDLTAASVVVHYDRWWNASKENQATSRVHRIGQKNFVQVFKLVSKGTLEEKIEAMIARKASLFDRFLEKDEEIFRTMSRQQLIDLLQ